MKTQGKPATGVLPDTRLLPRSALLAYRLKGTSLIAAEPAEAEGGHGILALYDDGTHTILLEESWTGSTTAELSILVHEMVHHAQNLSGQTYACAEAREKEAYAAQGEWLAIYGLSLESEFAIDPLTLLVRTSCAP